MENIVKIKKLKTIEIVYYKLEFDCNLLLELNNLESLKLVDVYKITNIEVLLKHKKLKHLEIRDRCKATENKFS